VVRDAFLLPQQIYCPFESSNLSRFRIILSIAPHADPLLRSKSYIPYKFNLSSHPRWYVQWARPRLISSCARTLGSFFYPASWQKPTLCRPLLFPVLAVIYAKHSVAGTLSIVDVSSQCMIWSNDNHGCTGHSTPFSVPKGEDCSSEYYNIRE
jgi:hypothetical protein